ncbi:FtsX-like permease family protein [Couchioplanes azureus]|uniref:FtsX-like permease family protein n=1 Tax=Couchioplanes caeruleus TaxID=56438 RepID=UPI00227D8EC2|nr:FtsX-like permease family protein [Couchioplanes caeruleus]
MLVLLTVGRGAGRRAGAGGTVHRWALFVAGLFTVLAFALLATVHAVSEASVERVAAREPAFVEVTKAPPVAKWMIHSDFVENRQFLILYVSPTRPDAPPPPGLPRWPEPGEVFLSPELATGPQATTLTSRYGTFAGTISHAGLANPTEKLAYYRPRTDQPFTAHGGLIDISHFGVDAAQMSAERSAVTVEGFQKWTVLDIYVVIAFVILLPVALLLLLAVRSNADVRDRRLAMLDALGAPTSARVWVLIGEALLPAITGVLAGAALAFLATTVDVRVPITGYLAETGDMAAARNWLAPLSIAALAAILALVVTMQLRSRARGETRPRRVREKYRGYIRATFPLSLAVATWGAMTARGESASRYSVGLVAFLIGTAVVLASLPSVLAAAAAYGGRVIARLGATTNSPGAIVGGRWLTMRPTLVARLCAAFVVGLGLLVQVQVQQAWIIQQTRGLAGQSTSTDLNVSDKLAVVRSTADTEGARAFAQQVGPDRVVQAVAVGDQTVLVGPCPALAHLGRLQNCSTTPVDMRSAYAQINPTGRWVQQGTDISGRDSQVTTSLPEGSAVTGFLVATDAGMNTDAVAAAAYAHLTKPYVSYPGQEWIAGGLAGAAVFDWLLTFGALGLIILTLAGALAAAAMFLSHAKSLGVLGTYDATPRLYVGVAIWNLGVPLLAAGIIGSITAAFLGFLTLQIRRVGSISYELLGIGFASVATIALLLSLACGLAAARSVTRWRPLAD